MLIQKLRKFLGLSRPARKNASREWFNEEIARRANLEKKDEAFQIFSFGSPDLDAGPIIEQDIARVDHKCDISELKRRGKDLEKFSPERKR